MWLPAKLGRLSSNQFIPHGVFCAPHTIDSMRAYGDESKSKPNSGDCENRFPSPLPSAALMSSAVKTCIVGDACEPDSLVVR